MSCLPSAPPPPQTPCTVHTRSLSATHPRPFLGLPHSGSTHFQAETPQFSPTPRETISCFSTRRRPSSPCARISTYDTPPSVASREALRPTPRPSPRLPPPTPSGPANRPAGALWGKRRPPPAPVLPPATCWDPARSAACLNFCPAQRRSGGRLKPVHLFSNNGVQRGEQNI